MGKNKLFALFLSFAILLSLSAFASDEASTGPASLTWETSSALSRENADIWQDEGSITCEDNVIVSSEDDFTAIFAEGGVMNVAEYTIFTTGREAQSPNTTMHFANANFYGTAAAVLAGVGAELTMNDITIVTTGEGANGIFTYGGILNLKDTVIECYGNENAHGIDAVAGGQIYGENLRVFTSGINSGAAATDTGGGYIELKDSSLTSRMAPGVYMDGDGISHLENVTVTVGFDRDGSAIDWMYQTNSGIDGVSAETKENTAEGLVLTGNAEITAIDTDVVAPCGVKFHSQSSTSQVGILTMTGGSLTSTTHDLIYVTGSNGKAVLDNVDCKPADGQYLIRVCNLVPANLAEPDVGTKICAATGDFTLKNGEYAGDVWALNAQEEEEWGAQLEDALRSDNSLKLTLDNAFWDGAATHINELYLFNGSVWNVTGSSDVTSLVVEEGCEIILPAGLSATQNGEPIAVFASGTYTNVIITG